MEKIARLCWNTNEWRCPSGPEGKSLDRETYENENMFGHEEWLLDFTKTIDGYHYGFLEAMRIESDIHYGKIYDIHLFTIAPNKQRVYIGCLKNAVGVSPEESQNAFNYYEKEGWIEEMQQDVLRVTGKKCKFRKKTLFNVKFRFEEAKINFSNQPILKSKSIGHRYVLMNKKGEFEFEKDEGNQIKMLDTVIFERTINAGTIQIDPLHKKIQNAIVSLLKKQYTKLQLESSADPSQRVDIKGFSKNEKEWHFFEVKTVSAKRCIREALGQILEYAHYPNVALANKLYIVGPEPPDEKDKAYMQLLREKYNLPIWFRWYSFAENKLYDGI
ncbi:MAG: hypothetical protein IKQ30_07410 [Bacteroidales bacterium]|nr:hypothetical protein [Bacteroidales bacterium]